MKYKFGEILKELREEKNLSQRQLAKIANISNSTIFRIESEQVFPDLSTIDSLCKALEISKKEFLEKSCYLVEEKSIKLENFNKFLEQNREKIYKEDKKNPSSWTKEDEEEYEEIECVDWVDNDSNINEEIHKELGGKLINAEALFLEINKLAARIKNPDTKNGLMGALNFAWSLPDVREEEIK